MSTAPPSGVRHQYDYHADKLIAGGVTYVTMHGTLNEGFDSRKLSASIRTKKLLINMRDVRRIASWGMSEWMDFLRVTADCDLYLVECSTYSVSQLNLITGLLGHSKLVSFYASYRCSKCNAELPVLVLIPRDRASIREIPNTQQECPTCRGIARLEDYPAAFFDAIADRPPFDIDDEALAFMRAHLKYDLSPDLTRFRAYRRVHKQLTYLRLTGNIATLPPDIVARAAQNTTVVDLAGIVFEPGQTSGFQTFVQTAKPNVEVMQLLDCPPRFLDIVFHPEDLDDKLKVRSYALMHRCDNCGTVATRMIDVAQCLEQLVVGEVPAARCGSCRAPLVPRLDPEEVAIMRALPARNRDPALDTFVAKCRGEPVEKLENWLVTAQAVEAPEPNTRRRLFIVAALAACVLVSALVFALVKAPNRSTRVATTTVMDAPNTPTFTRPEWIQSDSPSSGYCHDIPDRLMCVGVSSYRGNRDDGAAEASDAALEALVNRVALKIPTPYFKESVLGYSTLRQKTLKDLQEANAKRETDPRTAATHDEKVRKLRRSVVSVLESTGGAAVPAQRTDWYWEEYKGQTPASATEFLVFVRFDVSSDAMKALIDKYSSTTTVLGATVITAFPALAWQLPNFKGGAQVTKVGRQLASAGIAANAVVVAVGGNRVVDGTSLAQQVQSASGNLEITILDSDGSEKVVEVKR